MAFDPVVSNPGRLRILAALAGEPVQEFVRLRGLTRLTDGNLASHARRLRSAGMIDMEKSFRDGKPVTHFRLTAGGRDALVEHGRRVMEAVGAATGTLVDHPATGTIPVEGEEEAWID